LTPEAVETAIWLGHKALLAHGPELRPDVPVAVLLEFTPQVEGHSYLAKHALARHWMVEMGQVHPPIHYWVVALLFNEWREWFRRLPAGHEQIPGAGFPSLPQPLGAAIVTGMVHRRNAWALWPRGFASPQWEHTP